MGLPRFLACLVGSQELPLRGNAQQSFPFPQIMGSHCQNLGFVSAVLAFFAVIKRERSIYRPTAPWGSEINVSPLDRRCMKSGEPKRRHSLGLIALRTDGDGCVKLGQRNPKRGGKPTRPGPVSKFLLASCSRTIRRGAEGSPCVAAAATA